MSCPKKIGDFQIYYPEMHRFLRLLTGSAFFAAES